MRQEDKEDSKSPSEYWKILNKRRASRNIDAEPIPVLEYWNILKRRRFLFLLPFAAIAIAAFYLALSLPPTYRSEATILIEDQEIPEDIVGARITSYVNQQIQLISHRLLTANNIQSVVEKFEVYGPMNPEKPVPASVLASKFRNDIELEMIDTDVIGSEEGSVAFTLAFHSEDPEIAQKVTEELAQLFLNENQQHSALKASGVSDLLRAAINDANAVLLETDARLADFKQKNEGALPELHQLNLNVINRAEQQLTDVNLRIQQLQQRMIQLTAQITPLSPTAPVTLPSGEVIMSDQERLRALLVEFRRKSAVYQAGHPDLVRLEREIDSLQKTAGEPAVYGLLTEQLRQEREKLGQLRDRYSADHPDIKSTEAAIAEIESQLAATQPPVLANPGFADNPAYVMVKTQLQATELEIQNLFQKRLDLETEIAKHEALIKQAPRVEMQYAELLRANENAKSKYRDLQAQLRAAEVAADIGQELSARHFTVIEPPTLPLGPEGPNRPAIVVLGLFVALGVAAGSVVVAELTDNSIRSAKALMDIVGSPPLAVIPYLNNSADVANARAQWIYFAGAMFVVSLLCIYYLY